MKPALVILAAGMGSRYGGLKQIDSVGPNGELIIDYSIFDAISAGFKKIVFVIRKDFKIEFQKRIGNKYKDQVEINYAYQELDLCLKGFSSPEGREKPWGTGHAVLAAKDMISDPFTVINADDYYGPEAYKLILEYICGDVSNNIERFAMVGYILSRTLSEFGYVSRGVCEHDEHMYLRKLVERKKVERGSNRILCRDEAGKVNSLSGDEIVSMNFWGFQPSIFSYFEEQFEDYLKHRGHELYSEFFLPTVVDRLVRDGLIRLKILPTDNSWFGITYPEDRERAISMINKLITQGVYPKKIV